MKPKQSHWCRSGEIDWREFSSGEVLTKFVAIDTSQFENDGGYTVEVHGFFDRQGRFYITNEIVNPREEKE
jgi:hypothetical protein